MNSQERGEPPTTNRRSFLETAGATGATATGLLAGCLGGSGGGTVVFGQPAALTGKWDFLQPSVTQATKMAVSRINEAGGPLGNELKVVRRDTAVNPQQARTVVQQLVENDDAVVINGLFSSEITPLFDFLTGLEVPINTPWPGTNYLDPRGGDKKTDTLDDDGWVWRTIISDTVHTAGAAVKLHDEGFDRIGVINGTTQGARSWAEGFMDAFERGGGTVAKQVEVEEGASSYSAELDRLFDADFGAFGVSMGLDDAITLMSDWANAGYGRQPMVSDPLAQPELIENVGSEIEGALASSPTGQGPYYDTFIEDYRAFGDEEINPWGVSAYDAVVSSALAVEKAGSADRGAIEKALGDVTRRGGTKVSTFAEGKEALEAGDEINFQGASTGVNFTEYGNVLGTVSIQRAGTESWDTVETIKGSRLREFVGEY